MIENKNLVAFLSDKSDGNIAYHVQDSKENVHKNRIALAKKYHYKYSDLVYMEQVHSNNVVCVDLSSQKLQKQCDALITNEKNLPLMVMVADCIPVMFFDKVQEVIAVAHAGRNGVYTNIVSNVIEKMIQHYGSETQHIQVFLGASIQKCCYEVSVELANIASKSFGEEFVNGRLVDLQGICKSQLITCGIKNENIQIQEYCTKCNASQKYFSYRVQGNEAGRFAAVMMLKGNK